MHESFRAPYSHAGSGARQATMVIGAAGRGITGTLVSPLREGGAIGKNRPSDGFEVEVFSARTVDDALAEASAKLGLPAPELTYHLRDRGASGVLGIGSRPATIAVLTPAPHATTSPSRGDTGPYAGPPGDEQDASAGDRRVVRESARRLRAPIDKIRQRLGRDTESRRAEAGNGSPGYEPLARNRTEESQERAGTLEGELRAVRKELEAERLRGQQRDALIADLRSKLEEGGAGRRKAATGRSKRRAGGLALYPWQREALDWWQERGHRGVVEAVTGSGKTRLAIAAMAQQLRRGEPAVVVVPTKDLLHQWKRELERWLVGELGRPVSVGLLGANRKDNLNDHDVIVSTAQSGSRRTLLPRGRRGLLVADEVHHYGARSWSRILQDDFDRRLGLTATYEREDSGVERFLDPYFGGGVFRVDYARALADDVIAPFKIAFVGVRFSREERRRYEEHDEKASRYRRKLVGGYGLPEEPFGEFMREVNHLAVGGEEEATGLARAYLNAFSKRRQTLAGAREKFERVADLSAAVHKAERSILFAQTKEAAAIAVAGMTERGINGAVLTSSMDMSERKEVFAAFEDGQHELVAAPRLLDEGVDVPAADLAIVLASSRSRRQMVQRMGRVVRKKKDGRLARLAILYVVGSSEDPKVAHEDFLYLVTGVARDIVYFGPNASPKQICDYLNDWQS